MGERLSKEGERRVGVKRGRPNMAVFSLRRHGVKVDGREEKGRGRVRKKCRGDFGCALSWGAKQVSTSRSG